MVTKVEFDRVILEISQGAKLFPTLKCLNILAISFFKHLQKYPEDNQEYELALQIATMQRLDSMHSDIDAVETELELKKLNLGISTTKWEAEKLIPKVYGARVDINVNKTIDIRQILVEARARVDHIGLDDEETVINPLGE